MKVKLLSPVRLLATPWTAAYQAPLSMGFSRQEYWSGVPLPSPGTQASKVHKNSHPSLMRMYNGAAVLEGHLESQIQSLKLAHAI